MTTIMCVLRRAKKREKVNEDSRLFLRRVILFTKFFFFDVRDAERRCS